MRFVKIESCLVYIAYYYSIIYLFLIGTHGKIIGIPDKALLSETLNSGSVAISSWHVLVCQRRLETQQEQVENLQIKNVQNSQNLNQAFIFGRTLSVFELSENASENAKY